MNSTSNPLTLLLSCAGRRVQLLRCFRDSAKKLSLDLRIVATDADPGLSAACREADAAHSLPKCLDDAYPDALAGLCRREKIDLIVPTIDTELPVLAALASSLAAQSTRAIISSREAVAVARDKKKTSEALRLRGLRSPRTMSADAVLLAPDSWTWPLHAKPNDGSSSIGAGKVESPEALKFLAGQRPGLVVQELCRGLEYTVNLYIDSSGTIRIAVPHLRIEVRAGEVNKGKVRLLPRLIETAGKVAAAIPGLRGPVCFQAFLESDDAEPVITDLNARFGGGYPLAHAAGAEFTTWILLEQLGRPLPTCAPLKDGLTMLRYEEAFFLPAL